MKKNTAKKSKLFGVAAVLLAAVVFFAALVGFGAHRSLLRWGLQAYLGQILHAKVEIGQFYGGFRNGISAKNLRFYHPSAANPFMTVEEVATDFPLFGGGSPRNCKVYGLKMYFEECAVIFGEFSLPLRSGLVLLPPSRLWGTANFSLQNMAVVQSFNRPDNVLVRDIGGSLSPIHNQRVEFFLGTSKQSTVLNRLEVYGTFQASPESSNVDFVLDLKQLASVNLFLRSFNVLKGSARLEGKVRSGNLESLIAEIRDAELFFPKDSRVMKNLHAKLLVNEQYIAVKEFRCESNGVRFDLAGDMQRVSFKSGRVEVEKFLAKSSILAPRLSNEPLSLDFETTATFYYKHPSTLLQLRWHDDILESLSILQGKVNLNKLMDLEFQGKYATGLPLALDYKIKGLAFDKIKKDWFGDKLGSLFEGVRVGGEGRAVCQWQKVTMNGKLDWNESKMPYRFLWANQQFKLEDMRIDEATTLLGRLDLGARENSELIFHFKDESIMHFLQAMGPSKTASMTGKFTGELGFRGNMLDPDIKGNLDLGKGTLKGIPFREGKIELAGRFPKIFLDHSILYIKKDMPLSLSGFIDLSETDVFKNVHSEMNASPVIPST